MRRHEPWSKVFWQTQGPQNPSCWEGQLRSTWFWQCQRTSQLLCQHAAASNYITKITGRESQPPLLPPLPKNPTSKQTNKETNNQIKEQTNKQKLQPGLRNFLICISQLQQFFQGNATLIWRKQAVTGAPPPSCPRPRWISTRNWNSGQDWQLDGSHGAMLNVSLSPLQGGKC